MIGPASHYSFAVAVSVLHFVSNEDWWRRGPFNYRLKSLLNKVVIVSCFKKYRQKYRHIPFATPLKKIFSRVRVDQSLKYK